MSQHDMDVANGPGATVRTDVNNALQALASNSAGPLAPATTFPCQWWGDTATGRLKRRNIANSGWIDMGPLDTQGFLLVSGGTMTGPINDAPTQTIASATLTDIGAATSNVVAISGATTITGLGSIAAGARRTVRFLGSLLLTYNVTSLILPGNASITTVANDSAEFLSLGGGNWICVSYTRADGKALVFQPQVAPAWGGITGTLSAQTDLQAALTALGTQAYQSDNEVLWTGTIGDPGSVTLTRALRVGDILSLTYGDAQSLTTSACLVKSITSGRRINFASGSALTSAAPGATPNILTFSSFTAGYAVVAVNALKVSKV